MVCFQEVAPDSFIDDFKFMQDLGYDGVEMFKKGRFRPATFWNTDRVELTEKPVHKDRTLLTCFRRKQVDDDDAEKTEAVKNWYVLNCHLQAGKQAQRRVRQINEGVRAVLTLARKQKERDPEKSVRLIVCGDFNGGDECGALRYLEDGQVDETFIEDGEPVTSSKKVMPLASPLIDVTKAAAEREPPPTLVVPELIGRMVEGDAYENPKLSKSMIVRLTSIYGRLASNGDGDAKRMNVKDVKKWLTLINLQLGRGDEFREAARQMGWTDSLLEGSFQEQKARIQLPPEGLLTLDGFIQVYQAELERGKFWGIAHDMAVLGEPLPDAGVFEARFDRLYCSAAVKPRAVVDTACKLPCPNQVEPSDHLPVAAVFSTD